VAKTKNDRNHAVTKFCLAMEEHRRTEAGRVRTAHELVATFFPHDEHNATDKLFHRMPNEVRGPILSSWGIRGGKAALKDDDEKVRAVVHDAFVAGDIDDALFEDRVSAGTLVDWVALPEWWSFWRQGKLTGLAIQKALATARDLDLIDDRWFLANIQGRGGRLKGTDVVCDTLSKDQIVAWLRKIHESGDGSPAGLIAAIGWETVLAKTAQDALLYALDAFAKKSGLAPAPSEADVRDASPESERRAHEAKTEEPAADERTARDSGFPVAIPDIPVIDSAEVEGGAGSSAQWSPEESPKLASARAKMMEMLGTPPVALPKRDDWASDVPEKPSALEWPEPKPVTQEAKPPAPAPPLPKKGPAARG
jgi:hypothetical protein